MPEISKIKLTSGDEYNIKDTTAREMISSHTHTNESMGFGYGTCDTAASTTAKTVSISNYKLSTDGGIVSIKFDYDVLAGATLNINSTGAKPIYYNGAAITDNIIKAGDTATFIYDGTNYNLISLDRDFNPITVDTALSTTSTNPVENNVITNALNNHTHTNESMGFGYCHTNYDYFCGIVDDYALTDGDIILCEFTNDVPADAILNINSTGDKPIYYNGSPITYGIIKAEDTAILKYNENLDLSFSRFDFIGLYDFYELDANNSNSQEEINIDAPIYEIINGQNFNIIFDYDVPANATLNINNTGAKPIYHDGSPIKNNVIKANDNVIFIYNINDGRYDLLATDNYNNENVNHYYYGSALICYGITLDGYTQTKGGIVSIKFYYDVEPNATLNINSTGAKSIYHNGHFIRSDIIKAGDIATFIYDGTNDRYNLISLDRDFNIINESMGFGYGICIDSSTTAKTVSMYGYELTKGGIVSIKFYCAVPAKATLDINSTGAKFITYNGGLITDNIIKSGDTATFIYDGTNYNLISLDRDFNPITVDSSLSTTSNNPVQNSVITNALNNKADSTHTHTNQSMGFGYDMCTTAASTTAKTVSIYGGYELTKGGIVSIKFYCAVAAGSTLNINSTGAKSIYYNGSAITDGIIKAGDTATFIYDGTNYNLISLDRDFNPPITVDSSLSTRSTNPIQNNIITNALNNKADSTHTHSLESLGIAYAECNTEPVSSFPRTVSIDNFILKHNSIVTIKFKHDVSANATLNINNTGVKPMYHNNSTINGDIIKAGDIATFIYDGTNYNLISLDRDFNPITVDTALSTTSTNPVENNVITNALNNHTHTNESMGFGYSYTNYSYFCGIVDDYALTDGDIIICEFKYNVPANATLNINSTGDKPIYYNGSPITDGIIEAGDMAILKYNENLDLSFSRFDFIDLYHFYELDANNSNSQEEINIDAPIDEIEIINGQNFNIRFDYDVPANATLNIDGIDDDAKPIYYNGSPITNDIIKANDNVIFIYNINDGRYDLLATDNYNNENVKHFYYESALICYGITLDGYTQTKGGMLSIKFNYDVLAGATLNINSTGAKSIYHNGHLIRSDIIKAGDIATFIYDGTNYNLISLDRNFNFTNESIGFGYGICNTAASTTAKTVSMYGYELTKGGIVSIKFYNNVLSGATLNINSTGDKPIYYNGSAITDGIIKAGDTATFIYNGTNYNLISLDRDFNPITVDSSLSTTSTNPVQNSVITNALNNKADNTHTHTNESMGFGFGICTTTTSITAKTVSIPNYKLTNGGIVSIRFDFDVRADATLTLNISNTGALPIYYNIYSSSVIKSGDIATFLYSEDNHGYILISLDRNFNFTNESIGFGYGTCITAASTTAKTVSIINYKLTKGGIVSVKFNNDVIANATLNINITGAKSIYYKHSAITDNIIKAGDTATFIYDGTNYNLISLDRDFNDPITVDSSLSTTSTNPVQNNVITNALNNYIPTIVGTQIESTNNWTGNAQFEMLEDGQRILYYLPYDNSSGSDVVLNLTLADGTTQTGNINCYLSGSTRLNSQYEAGNFIPLIYKENIAFNGSSTTYTGWWAYTDKDIDSKVQNTLNNTTKAYITGTTNNTTNIGTQIFDNNVYLGTTAGELNTKSLKLNEKVALNYNNDNNCIDFIFS